MIKILVVDDHSANRFLLSALIRQLGHVPVEAADGVEALTLARAERPQLIISDIVMPSMDGYEFVRQLRADAAVAEVPVIFYTAHYHEQEARNLAKACGVDRVLLKPASSAELSQAIEESLLRPVEPVALQDAGEFDKKHLRLVSDKLSEKLSDLQLLNTHLQFLNTLGLSLMSEREPQAILEVACDGAQRLLGAGYAVLRVGELGSRDCYLAVAGSAPEALVNQSWPDLHAGLLGRCLAEVRPVRTAHGMADVSSLGLPPGFPPFKTSLAAPIASSTALFGWVCLCDKPNGQEFTETDEHLLLALASQAGRVYENNSLYAEVQRHAEKLKQEARERKAQQAQLDLALQMVEQSRESIVVTDRRRNIIMVNKAFTHTTGYLQDEVVGQKAPVLNARRQGAAFQRSMREAIVTAGAWQGEVWVRRKDGSEYPAWLTVNVVRDAKGQICNFVCTSSDITEKKAAEERISWLSHFDALTGLPNRMLLGDRCGHDISVAVREAKPLAMMIVGVEQFRMVNDTMGHATGDLLLQQIAQRLRNALREEDTVARVGNSDFAMVLPGSSAEGVSLLSTRLLHVLDQPYLLGGTELSVGFTMGIAMYPTDGVDFDTLFKCAEVAMHQAEGAGRGTPQFFNAESFESTKAQMGMAAELRLALSRNQLRLNYQPFADFQTGHIGGLEALLRWTHPELGAVPPSQFIPIAEHSGAIIEIGAWVLRQACADIKAWLAQGLQLPPVSVNLSPVQFRDKGLVAFVSATLREYGVRPDMVCLEVTEGVLMENAAYSEALLSELKSLGIRLSLDDFGTGYSSLSYLKAFPFDKVKIDQSFVRDITTSSSAALISKVIISLAHGLGLRVIAEGVETEGQCNFLRGNVCDEIQGYFFSHPVAAAEISEMFKSGKSLPSHLLRLQERTRTLLLVDDEPNVIAALKRLLRRDGYKILSANSGVEGLELLAKNAVDIIVSDQRMPGMTGVEFLRQAKALYPATTRIVLSGYTELKSVTDAINEGAVYRFLTKPWDDTQLRDFIEEAFRHKELADENEQLNLKVRTANQELASSNRQLQEVLSVQQQKVARAQLSLDLTREVLQHIPLPVVGIDDAGLVVLVNEEAQRTLPNGIALLGEEIGMALPDLGGWLERSSIGESSVLTIGGARFRTQWQQMGQQSDSKGRVVTLMRVEEGQ